MVAPDPSVPQVSPTELAEWLNTRPELVLLDVREPFELAAARLKDDRVQYAPLSRLAEAGEIALPPGARNPRAQIVVFCHHGIRSVQVCWWLRQIGWEQVYNLTGGLEAYASQVDPSVGFY